MNPEPLSTSLAGGATAGPVPRPTDETATPVREEAAVRSGDGSDPDNENSWRQELASRLNRYQARRKPRPPRYPSLRLRFDADNAHTIQANAFQSHAVAVNSFAQRSDEIVSQTETPLAPSESGLKEVAVVMGAARETVQALPTSLQENMSAKVIEFPRFWTPPEPPADQLAEPVCERPRILEVPDVDLPPPALGGITIEPAPMPERERRPGIDLPLQTAPMERRVFSAAIDGIVVLSACFLFGFVFCQISTFRPPPMQVLAGSTALFALFWSAYQYLLLVYSGSTPGLRLAKLKLARFDGSAAGRKLRRWRVLASFLSAVSLGMGFAWVFLDEDALCWHDRITQTYLAPESTGLPESKFTTEV
jgi:uncharacterized RDD family membrane protein YckC